MFGSLSLVHGILPILITVLAGASLIALLARRDGVWKRQLVIGLPVAAVLVGLITVAVITFSLIPFSFPSSFYVVSGGVVLAIVLSVIGWRRFGLGRRLFSGVAILLTLALALTFINSHYEYYPTVKSLFGVDAHHLSPQQRAALEAYESRAANAATAAQRAAAQRALEQARMAATGNNADAPTKGATIQIAIPGTVSGFKAREAYVWLPPVWFTDPTRKLPVIELLAGAPGTPADWIQGGFADQAASRYAQAHGGLAPIVAMPDSNGSDFADTECVDSSIGNAETYLTVDVPAFVRANFGAATTPDSMAIAGLSAGGMCASMLALRHPTLYGTFGDYAGLTSPTVGESVNPAATIQSLFGGSVAAYQAHDPLHLLATNTYPGMAGWYEVGTDDGGPLAAQHQLVPLARSAGIEVHEVEVPGAGHTFSFFAQAFADSLPFLCSRLGLTTTSTDAA
jgi:S-formylglutathione hydrolase FrmB